MHGTTDPEALNDGTLTRREYPPITSRPRVPVKRWTVRTVGQPTSPPTRWQGWRSALSPVSHHTGGHDEGPETHETG